MTKADHNVVGGAEHRVAGGSPTGCDILIRRDEKVESG
jgi:hypothetical protein